jgi:hypothetical protein
MVVSVSGGGGGGRTKRWVYISRRSSRGSVRKDGLLRDISLVERDQPWRVYWGETEVGKDASGKLATEQDRKDGDSGKTLSASLRNRGDVDVQIPDKATETAER